MARTGMRAVGSLDQKWLGKIFDAGTVVKHAKSGFTYRPYRKGTKYFVEETLLAADGSAIASWQEPVTHLLSAGRHP